MQPIRNIREFVRDGGRVFVPSLSLDCVIFGFHENELKVLLLKMKGADEWALPGGFIYNNEDVDAAAARVLRERTGLDNIFLQQFRVFGNPGRSDRNFQVETFRKEGIVLSRNSWLLNRFLTVGYYALVDFATVIPEPDFSAEACAWRDLDEIGELFMDHRQILDSALEALRLQLTHQPIGFNLLPKKFTMPELQKLYETILGKKLDRRNFQRRMTAYGILKKLPEIRKGGAHKAPFLYSFDLKRYKKALKGGLQGDW